MPSSSSNNKLIAKNSLILYANLVYSLLLSLFTARVVLNSLGFSDYGLYNVIGSVVSMFVFLRSSMGNSVHRYITFYMGKGDFDTTKKIFSLSLIIHVALALLMIMLLETIGLWFLNAKIVIPEGRDAAANWVYQFSVISIALTVISVPYEAEIIAHEKMGAFAFVQFLNSTLNLLIIYLVKYTSYDKLIVYGFLLMMIQVVNRWFYVYYCRKHFKEASFEFVKDRKLLVEMTGFAGWAFIGNIAYILYSQGLNIVLNLFFGPVINAARAISYNVQGAIKGFVTNFQTAVNPQITKSYAAGEIKRLHSLIYTSSKFSFYLLLCMIIPIAMEIKPILILWLNDVPDHTYNFTIIVLIMMMIDPLANPLLMANRATGKIRNYQIVEGGLLLLIVPISWLFLKLGYAPESVFIVQLIIFILTQIARIVLVCHHIGMGYMDYFKNIVLKITVVSVISLPVPFLMHVYLPESIIWTVTKCGIGFIYVAAMSILFGFSKQERKIGVEKIKSLLLKRNKNE